MICDSQSVKIQTGPDDSREVHGDFTILKGEAYQPSDAAVLCSYLREPDAGFLSRIMGEFTFVSYSHATRTVYFGTDRLGRENLFYYSDGKRLVIGDDFWEIASYLDIGISDVDMQSLKEFVAFNYPVLYGTIIRDVSFVPPATYARFQLDTGDIRLTRYWDIRYAPDPSISLVDAVEQLDTALDRTFKQILSLNPERTFGVGLSGGLDSRLIPHYAKRNNMPIRGFIIGQSRPHGVLLSRDHRSARAIADFYGIHQTEVEWDADSYQEKMRRDVRNYPMGTSEFFITVGNGIPDFDVLLTGSLGMIVGSSVIPQNIHSMSREELLNSILTHCSLMGKGSTLRQKFVRAVRVIGGTPMRENGLPVDSLVSFLSKDGFENVVEKFAGLVGRGLDSGKSNLEVFAEYHWFFVGSRGKGGAFESLQGLKKSYSIYSTHVLDAVLHWPPQYLPGRPVLKEIVGWIDPKLATIERQDYLPPLTARGSFVTIQRTIAMAKYLLRGGGVGRHEQWVRMRAYQQYARGILHRPNPVFESMGGFEKLTLLSRGNPRFFEKMVKAKVILDMIDSGEYKRLLEVRHAFQQPVRVWTS